MAKSNTKLFLEGCKWTGAALISWLLLRPHSSWFELEKAKESFASMKRDTSNGKA